MTADLDLPTEQQARALTDRIKVAVEGTWLLIQEAYTSQAWSVLGYASWDLYVDAEFRAARLALPREERAETIQSLRSVGMSTRAIASATGLSQSTVARATESFDSVAEVTGVNGKTYAASHPAPQSDADLPAGDDWAPDPAPEPKPKRRPITDAIATTVVDLGRAAHRVERLTADDRFPRNLDAARRHTPELLGALERTTDLITALNLPKAEANEEARRWWATSLNKIADALHGVATSIEQEM